MCISNEVLKTELIYLIMYQFFKNAITEYLISGEWVYFND